MIVRLATRFPPFSPTKPPFPGAAVRGLVVVEVSSKYSQVAKKSKSLNAVFFAERTLSLAASVVELSAEVVAGRVPRPLIWMKSVWRKDGAQEPEIEDIGAVVAVVIMPTVTQTRLCCPVEGQEVRLSHKGISYRRS
jgi:hypothetical protein